MTVAQDTAIRKTSASNAGERRPQSSRDRDRFVGFAFAAADLLIETDSMGTILFSAGAAAD